MDVNAQNLSILNTAVSTAFNNAFGAAESSYQRIATVVPSTNSGNTYAWLGKSNQIREWLGPRVINRLQEHQYTIKNKKFEKTEAIGRDEIEDDEYGVYMPLFAQMGQDAKAFPDLLTFPLLKAGFETLCYDGQNFFDADHPVKEGSQIKSVSNMQAGGGAPWFLLCTKRPIKPMIWQKRRDFNLVMKTNAQASDHVFMNDEYVWGTDGRCNAGFGLWQLAFGSKATLDEANFEKAFCAMESFKNDAGSPLGIVPDLLVVGPGGRAEAEKLLKALIKDGGASNTNYEKVELLVCPWLA